MSDSYIVAVVLDPTFGDRLRDLPVGTPVWIADTPVNRAAAEALWVSRPELTHLDGVTTFRIDPGSGPEVWLAEVLPDLDLHHGEYSHVPPYAGIEVFGAGATPVVREALGQLGIGNITERPGGFLATSE
jgi:hypothetical protein